ncbi:MAG: carboxypeptidase-like regulatory domain-containing protein [Phaeodactylibacter sp.]|uniref:TonB-dependent receptor plug domain-containing protein n=1 Tax=Phaeodactylibacter sp. TaxID=1940289 RepID=UPI0032F01D3A
MKVNIQSLGLLWVVLIPAVLFGQDEVSGQIIDKSGAPVFAANVYLKQHPATGVLSDMDGRFSLPFSSPEDTLVVSFLGYETQEVPLSRVGQALQITLEENTNILTTVQVAAKRPVAQDFALMELNKFDIYTIPFSFADPLKALTVLPSSTNTEESAAVNLRGSSSGRSIVVLDGVPLANPVRSTSLGGNGFFSIFNTEMVERVTVFASNPSLAYGNATAGMVEVETVEQVDDPFWQASAGLGNAGLFHGRPLGKRSSLHVYGNHQFSGAFLEVNGSNIPDLRGFSVADGGFKLHSQLRTNLLLDWYGYGLSERSALDLNLFAHRGPAEAQTNRHFQVARLRLLGDIWSLSANVSGDFTASVFDFGNLRDDNQSQRYYASLNGQLNLFETWTLSAGITTEEVRYHFRGSEPDYYFAVRPTDPARPISGTARNNNTELYLLSRSRFFSERLSVISGFRKNIPVLTGQPGYFSRQLITKFHFTDEHTLSGTIGQYNGYLNPNFFNRAFNYVYSDQGALEYAYDTEKIGLNAAIFHKSEGGDIRFAQDGTATDRRLINGIEAQVRYRFHEHLELQASYAYLDVENTSPEGMVFNGQNDLDYFVRVFLTYDNPSLFNLSAAWVHRQGLWYTPVIGSQWQQQANAYEPIFAALPNQARMDNYHSLSLNWSKTIPLQRSFLVAFITLNNALNIENQQEQIFTAPDYSAFAWQYLQQRSFYFGAVLNW